MASKRDSTDDGTSDFLARLTHEELTKIAQNLLFDLEKGMVSDHEFFIVNALKRSYQIGKEERARAKPEIVICAAVKTKSGKVIRCHRHCHGFATIQDMPNDEIDEEAQGFVTSTGRYVDREEGRALQVAAGIPSADPTSGGKYGNMLFSEDLY